MGFLTVSFGSLRDRGRGFLGTQVYLTQAGPAVLCATRPFAAGRGEERLLSLLMYYCGLVSRVDGRNSQKKREERETMGDGEADAVSL